MNKADKLQRSTQLSVLKLTSLLKTPAFGSLSEEKVCPETIICACSLLDYGNQARFDWILLETFISFIFEVKQDA